MNGPFWILLAIAFYVASAKLYADANLEKLDALEKMYIEKASEHAVDMAKYRRPRKPSAEFPFIFFHMRKCGGTSARLTMVNSAKRHGLEFFVPCHDASNGYIECETYGPPQYEKREIAVFGGHFYYSRIHKYLYRHIIGYPSVAPPTFNYTSLTILRNPIDRVISCWNFRMANNGGRMGGTGPPLGELSVSEVEQQLPLAMSKFFEGCNNEFARVLSSYGDAEETINTLTAHGTTSPIFSIVVEEVLEHMFNGVVGILERCEDTQLVVKYYMPWFTEFDCEVVELKSKVAKTHSPEIEAEILKQNWLDVIVYRVGNKLLDAQVEVARKQDHTLDGHMARKHRHKRQGAIFRNKGAREQKQSGREGREQKQSRGTRAAHGIQGSQPMSLADAAVALD